MIAHVGPPVSPALLPVAPIAHGPAFRCRAPVLQPRVIASSKPRRLGGMEEGPRSLQPHRAASKADAATAPSGAPEAIPDFTRVCVSLMRDTVDGMLQGAREAQAEGADLVEIRLDALTAFDPANDIPRIIAESPLPIIITLRPTWEGCAGLVVGKRGIDGVSCLNGPGGGNVLTCFPTEVAACQPACLVQGTNLLKCPLQREERAARATAPGCPQVCRHSGGGVRRRGVQGGVLLL